MKFPLHIWIAAILLIVLLSQHVTAQSSEQQTLGPPPAVERSPIPSETSAVPLESTKVDDGLFHPQFKEFIRVTGALAIVIGLILVIRVVLKKLGSVSISGARPSGVLEVLARYPIARGQQLMVLRFARRIVLIHQSNASVSTVCEVTDRDEVAGILSRMEAGANERDGSKFRAALKDYESRYKSPDWPQGKTEVIDLTRMENSGV